MPRIRLSARHYLSRIAEYHCNFSFAFNTMPEQANDANEEKLQRTLTMISDFADFYDDHIVDTELHPLSPDPDLTIKVINLLSTRIGKYQKAILNKMKTYKNVNIVVLEQDSSY